MCANSGEVAVMECGIDFIVICLQNTASYIVMQVKDTEGIVEMLVTFSVKRPKPLLEKKVYAYRSLK